MNRFDWKFAATLVVTIASVAIPVWLWQIDLASRAVSLSVVSTTELLPQTAPVPNGFKLTFENQELKEPFVSVVEISNTGSRPISQSDFETKIELSTTPPVRIETIQIASVSPQDLRPKVSAEGGKFAIEPLLLNPKDSIRLSILTTGSRPTFATRSRIAGVGAIEILDRTSRYLRTPKFWFQTITGVLVLSVYMALVTEWVLSLRNKRPRFVLLGAGFVCCAAGISLLDPFRGSVPSEFHAWLQTFLAALAIVLPYTAKRFMEEFGLRRPSPDRAPTTAKN